jgi:hypothetical protein
MDHRPQTSRVDALLVLLRAIGGVGPHPQRDVLPVKKPAELTTVMR